MTAIAYRDGVMAADSLVLGADTVRGMTTKISRSPAGTIGAASGKASACQLLKRWIESGKLDAWLESGAEDDFPAKAEENGFGAIVVDRHGVVTTLDWQGRPIRGLRAPFFAEGGATAFLVGAMAAGASAVEAVRLATQYDVGCGGPVQVERVSEAIEVAA